MGKLIRHAHGELSTEHVLVMGILNRTPDSFFDGGRMNLESSVDHAMRMVAAGADVVDIGGVKAGPGTEVSLTEELDRTVPLVPRKFRRATPVPISVETARPAVAEASIEAGAGIINDVERAR